MQNDMKKWIMLMCAFIYSQAMAQDDFESLGGVRLGMTDNEAEQVMAANGMKQTVTKGHRVFYEGNEVELYGVFFNKACIEYIEGNTWINLHEEQLMQKIYGFDTWMHIYGEWKDTDKTKQMAQALRLHMQDEHSSVN